MTDKHFDKVGEHLSETIQELDIKEALIDEVIAIVETTRNEVLNR